MVELPDHPWFLGCQFHPEYKSKPTEPAPALPGMTTERVELAPGVVVGGGAPLAAIAGPCVVEDEATTLAAAPALAAIARGSTSAARLQGLVRQGEPELDRTFRGPGLAEGLRVLAAVRAATGLPLLTDVHEPGQCERGGRGLLDVLQIPAFLCRQTDLVVAAAQTGRAVNVKKGQFMAPDDMRRVVEKARSAGRRARHRDRARRVASATTTWWSTCARSPGCSATALR
jgi:3-deoxy-D-manno-octulosonic acid (KDO) 8-phosphate synthase